MHAKYAAILDQRRRSNSFSPQGVWLGSATVTPSTDIPHRPSPDKQLNRIEKRVGRLAKCNVNIGGDSFRINHSSTLNYATLNSRGANCERKGLSIDRWGRRYNIGIIMLQETYNEQHVVIGSRPSANGAAPAIVPPVPPNRRRLNEGVFDIEAFLQELPEDEFSPQEAALRVEIIKQLFRGMRRATDKSSVVARVAEAPSVEDVLASFSLPAAHWEDWMRERVGNEFLVSRNEHGDAIVELEKNVKFPHRGTAEHEHISEEFFSSLPLESFAPEEQDLRDGICDFIGHFKGNGFPTLSIMCQDREVGRAKCALLPRGVSLKEWIEKRCGEDFDLMLNHSNQNCIGHAGTLDPEGVAMSTTEKPDSLSHSRSHQNSRRRKGGKGAKR